MSDNSIIFSSFSEMNIMNVQQFGLTFDVQCRQIGMDSDHVAQRSHTGGQHLLQPWKWLPIGCNRIEGLRVILFIRFVTGYRFRSAGAVCKDSQGA